MAGAHAGHEGHAPAAGGSYQRSLQSVDLPDVSLTGDDGATTTSIAVLAGDEPVLLQFIFTTCPTICPVLSAIFATTQDLLGDELGTVRLVSVSIDPEHDTAAVLKQHAEKFGAGPAWRFYTGRLPDIRALQKAFDAYQGNKMSHEPLIFLRRSADRDWVRLDGLMSAQNLMAEYRQLESR